MHAIPESIAAFGAIGIIFICPLVYMLMRHQRAMAELIHRSAGDEVIQRLAALEREVLELRRNQAAAPLPPAHPQGLEQPRQDISR